MLLTKNFGVLLMKVAKGLMFEAGQKMDHWSYILRLNSTASCFDNDASTSSGRSSYISGRTNLSGDSTIPSREMNKVEINFLIARAFLERYCAIDRREFWVR